MTKLANLVGVSQATISRVINDQPGVSKQVARKVLDAMEQTGYKPRLRSRKKTADKIRAGVMAMVVEDKDIVRHAELFTRTLFGVTKALERYGLKLIMSRVSPEGEFFPVLKPNEVDGVLVVGGCSEQDILRHFGHVPMVWLTSHSDRAGDHILAGNEAVGRLAAEYLYKKGKTNLVFFNPDPSFQVYRSRWAAFRLMAEELDTQVCAISNSREGLIAGSGFDRSKLSASLDKMVDELLEKDLGTTGVFIPDDIITAVLYPVLRQKGIMPEKDLLLVSCCNEQAYLTGLEPAPPATIDLGHELMGHRAVEQLLWRIRNPELEDDRPLQVTISPMLVE